MMNYRSSISLQRYSPTVALRQIQAAPDNDNLARSAGILPELACILINNKTAVSQDNRLITDFADMTMVRAIELAVGKLGRPPIGVFGNFIVENKRHKTDVLDIKSVMNLVVDFARIYALKHGLKERNTHERLKALREAGIFSDQSYYELKIALSYLMRIRLDKQAVSIDQGLSPDNFVSPDLLTSIDQKILKEIFVQIKNFQVRLSYDFTGMMSN